MVGEEGFEPTRPVRPADFKSASSAGSDTRPRKRSCHPTGALPSTRHRTGPAEGGERRSRGPVGGAPSDDLLRELRRRADSNRRMGVLQTPALPLGYVAAATHLEREMGLEPTAFSLARRRSTSELLPQDQRRSHYSRGPRGVKPTGPVVARGAFTLDRTPASSARCQTYPSAAWPA